MLEVGCGTGANLELLRSGVSRDGRVTGTDISPGMLARAERLRQARGWSNVELLCQDATDLDVAGPFDAILFSLSYSVLPERRRTLEAAWGRLRAGGRLVIMDAGRPPGRRGRLLDPLTRALSRLTVLGNPHLRPWEDLAALAGSARTRRLRPDTYFLCSATRRA